MKKVSSIIAATALMISVSAASFAAAPAKKPAKKTAMKEWTFAVFLNADNNLDRFGVEDQEEMARVGSNEYVNIISLIDRERGPAQINYIEKGNIKKIKDMGEMDMGDYKELVKFAKFVKENYPAKHYMIGIWNHGSGWKAKQDASNVVRGISYDDSSSNHITNDQLAIATKEIAQVLGQKIDVINMDACLMGMAEVAYAIKDNCEYFVGSEETEAGKGTPYDDVLKGLKPGMSARDFANHWVNAYAESYNGGSQGRDDSTQSAYDLSKTDALLDAMDGFAKAIMSGKYADKVTLAAGKTVKFAYPQNIDLLHFLKNLRPEVQGDSSLITAMDKVEKAAKAMIINNKTTGRYYNKYENAEGIAVYLPSNLAIESKYLTLDYSKKVMWDDMLMALRQQRDVQVAVDKIIKGDYKPLKSAISEAKKNPRSAYVKALLREINYAAYTEKRIKSQDKAEFERLFKELKDVMHSK